ncbi:hypothetical protein [Tenacibaculum aiptasiae]|uniref:hypothetical protein n=1 Tax=Tenacibaculum aiptasiae TaxID=426481 RepID=UPI003B59B275
MKIIEQPIKNSHKIKDSKEKNNPTRNSFISEKDFEILDDKIAFANVSKSDYLKIKDLGKEYYKGFLWCRIKMNIKSRKVFNKADDLLNSTFKPNSFAYEYCQVNAMAKKSYLEFKLQNKESAIELTKRGINYIVLLQNREYLPYIHFIGIHMQKLIQNLAKVHLVNNEIEQWYNITLENINLFANFIQPKVCPGFNISSFKKIPFEYRYSMLIQIISETIMNIHQFNINGVELLFSNINIEDKSTHIAQQIDCWIKLNSCIDQKNAETDSFSERYFAFLESENKRYDLRIFKHYLKNRIQKEGIQLKASLVS